MLAFEDISVRYGRKTVLKAASATLQSGQVIAIVGPNGSGKTTLLRAISGDTRYDGTVALNGQDLSVLKPWQIAEERAVLPQISTLAFPFQVIEIVRLGAQASTTGHQDVIAQAALARVGLSGYANRFYQELSGGEQQRVQLARVLCQVWQPVVNGRPRWLLMDEPVSSLDIGHQLEVMQIARDFADQGGGVLAVMHDLNLTAGIADRVLLVHAGQIIADGTVDSVLTDDRLSNAYGCPIRTRSVPANGRWFLLPGTNAA
ncbi:heme ABC transporter ATP-binding protein [Pseudaestuariivita rosea]|uniref:heme ABC transporter ATP-binding protein n=1 Tax=Pseudaestuariivita rosea TaxID=2763263 RepID=UPI001ABAE41A|nr:heme ABC transporter ATP-binding protein [Pseudaestuariivita rosea]